MGPRKLVSYPALFLGSIHGGYWGPTFHAESHLGQFDGAPYKGVE